MVDRIGKLAYCSNNNHDGDVMYHVRHAALIHSNCATNRISHQTN